MGLQRPSRGARSSRHRRRLVITPATKHRARQVQRHGLVRLAAVLTAFGLLGLLAGCGGASADRQHLDVAGFAKLTQTQGTTVIDVRTPEEYAAGHLPGAVNLDVNGTDFQARLAPLSRSGTYALYCHSGNRSGQALTQMSSKGFTHVSDLAGGIQAWLAEERAVTTG